MAEIWAVNGSWWVRGLPKVLTCACACSLEQAVAEIWAVNQGAMAANMRNRIPEAYAPKSRSIPPR